MYLISGEQWKCLDITNSTLPTIIICLISDNELHLRCNFKQNVIEYVKVHIHNGTNQLFRCNIAPYLLVRIVYMHNTLLRCSVVYLISQIYDLVVVTRLVVVQYDDFGVVVYNCYYQAYYNFFCVSEIEYWSQAAHHKQLHLKCAVVVCKQLCILKM